MSKKKTKDPDDEIVVIPLTRIWDKFSEETTEELLLKRHKLEDEINNKVKLVQVINGVLEDRRSKEAMQRYVKGKDTS